MPLETKTSCPVFSPPRPSTLRLSTRYIPRSPSSILQSSPNFPTISPANLVWEAWSGGWTSPSSLQLDSAVADRRILKCRTSLHKRCSSALSLHLLFKKYFCRRTWMMISIRMSFISSSSVSLTLERWTSAPHPPHPSLMRSPPP